MSLINLSSQPRTISREFKQDVYGRRQMEMANGKDYFCLLFFSSNPQTNPWHTHTQTKRTLTIHGKYKYFHCTVQTDEEGSQKQFHFCRLPFSWRNVMLISLLLWMQRLDTVFCHFTVNRYGLLCFQGKEREIQEVKGWPAWVLYLDVREGSL